MVSILVWISPWAAIMLVDYFVLRRGRLDVAALYERVGETAYPNFNGPGLISLAAGIVAGWSWQYGLVPVRRALSKAADEAREIVDAR